MENNKEIINELLVDVFNQILAIEQTELKNMGIKLSMNEVHVIEAVYKSEHKGMSSIAKILRITLGSLTISVDNLVRKGYLVRQYDPNDRRKVLLALTESGNEVMDTHSKFHHDMLENLFLDTSIDEDLTLIKTLNNLKSYFKAKY